MAPHDVGVGWTTHGWVLPLAHVEWLECNVYVPLVLWFEVSIFPSLAPGLAVWVYNASVVVMTAS